MNSKLFFTLITVLALMAISRFTLFGGDNANAHIQKLGDQYRLVDYSKSYTIDKIYPSMKGPSDFHEIRLWNTPNPELLWITSAKMEILSAESEEAISSEYLCHGNFNLAHPDWDERKAMFGNTTTQEDRKAIELMQGQEEIRFPKSFGIPVLSNEPFIVGTMALNYIPVEKPFDLKIKSSFEFVREKENPKKMKPLFRKLVSVKVPVKAEDRIHKEGESCDSDFVLPTDINARSIDESNVSIHKNGFAQDGHWLIPPGRHVYRYTLEEGLDIPFDTTAHFIAVHLHAYGQYMEIIDLTTQETVFKSTAQNFDGRPGIAHLDEFASVEGIKLYKDHDYELVTEYNNPTNHEIDAMAVMSIYMFDKGLDLSKIQY